MTYLFGFKAFFIRPACVDFGGLQAKSGSPFQPDFPTGQSSCSVCLRTQGASSSATVAMTTSNPKHRYPSFGSQPVSLVICHQGVRLPLSSHKFCKAIESGGFVDCWQGQRHKDIALCLLYIPKSYKRTKTKRYNVRTHGYFATSHCNEITMTILFVRRASHPHTLIFEERGIRLRVLVRERILDFPHNTKILPVPDHVITSRPICLVV